MRHITMIGLLILAGSSLMANSPKLPSEIIKLKEKIELNKNTLEKLNGQLMVLLQSVKFSKKTLATGGQGVEIKGIPPGSLLEAIGLINEDIIVGINNIKFENPSQSLLIFDSLKTAKNFILKIRRGQSLKEIEIKIK